MLFPLKWISRSSPSEVQMYQSRVRLCIGWIMYNACKRSVFAMHLAGLNYFFALTGQFLLTLFFFLFIVTVINAKSCRLH